MKDKQPNNFSELIDRVAGIWQNHSRNSEDYRDIDKCAQLHLSQSGFADDTEQSVIFGQFGPLIFPFTRMGSVTSVDLFGTDELILFAFYWKNRSRYRKVADIGANLGLHSILMSRCGWRVRAFEPDPKHVALLRRNLELNQCHNVTISEAAVSDKAGNLEFIRVLGNTTSSHLGGAKNNSYGDLETFEVRVESIKDIMSDVDFVKMDAEGQEKTIILATSQKDWDNTEMVVEIGSSDNANAIFEHLEAIGVRAFAQRLGWRQVGDASDMPTSYKDGSLFISRHHKMPWQ